MSDQKFLDTLAEYGIHAIVLSQVSTGRLVLVESLDDTDGLDEGEDACVYGEAVEEKCGNKFQFLSASSTEYTETTVFEECENAFFAAFPEDDSYDWFMANNVYYVPNIEI
mgnify:CR=1 FL=1